MKKTVQQWIETLPYSLRKSAEKQLMSVHKNVRVERLSGAIMHFACWNDTKEGVDFWSSFHDALISAEKLDSVK